MVRLSGFALAAAALFGLAFCSDSTEIPPQAKVGHELQDRYVVVLKRGLDMKSHLTWVKNTGNTNVDGFGRQRYPGVEKIYQGKYGRHAGYRAYAGCFEPGHVEKIKKHPDVKLVEKDRVYQLQYMPEEWEFDEAPGAKASIAKASLETQTGAPWGLGTVSHRKKGSTTYIYDSRAGANTFAYVVDSGVRTTHSQFGGRATMVWSAFDGDTSDSTGHGTHVSGIIAGKTYGVAKKAKILGVKVFQGDAASASIVMAGFNWAANDIMTKNRTAKSVVNMSLGGPASDAINDIVNAAASSGVLTVVAAGNDGQSANGTSPASAQGAVTVGAINSDWQIADYSNYGEDVDIFAPGSSIISAWNTSDTALAVASGTSMASPHIAGLALYDMSVEGDRGVTAVSAWLTREATQNKITGNLQGSPNKIGNNHRPNQSG